jgi:Protein of unknown function DUF262.
MKNTKKTTVVLENELGELIKRLHLIPEPTYTHKVGAEVVNGSLRDVVVEEVLEGGKIYKLDFTDYNSNYGSPILTSHQKRYVDWTSVRKKVDSTESFIENDDIKLRFMQEHIRSLIGKAYDTGIDFEPDYQRDFVWELEDKVNLIDSIFKNVDIGKFVLIFKGYSEVLLDEILDGKQRLRAILDYYEDRFAYNGKFFSDLSEKDRRHFVGYSISVCEVENLTEEQILRYFLYLNISGKAMSKAHLDKIKDRLRKIEEKSKTV